MLDSEPVVDPEDPEDELVSTNPVEEEVVSVSECSPLELELELELEPTPVVELELESGTSGPVLVVAKACVVDEPPELEASSDAVEESASQPTRSAEARTEKARAWESIEFSVHKSPERAGRITRAR